MQDTGGSAASPQPAHLEFTMSQDLQFTIPPAKQNWFTFRCYYYQINRLAAIWFTPYRRV